MWPGRLDKAHLQEVEEGRTRSSMGRGHPSEGHPLLSFSHLPLSKVSPLQPQHTELTQQLTCSHFKGQSRHGLKSHQRHNFHLSSQIHVSNPLPKDKGRQHSSSWPPA